MYLDIFKIRTVDNHIVTGYRMSNKQMMVDLLSYGAAIHRIRLSDDDFEPTAINSSGLACGDRLALSLDTVGEYRNHPLYAGATLAPNAGRISDGYFFQIPEEHLSCDWKFDESKYFEERDYLYSWQGKNLDELKVILPFHVWDYDESKIMDFLEINGLVNKEKSNPMMTRCKILDTMCYMDKNRIGYDGFIAPFSDLIRMGKASRQKYYEMFYGNAYQLNMDHVNEVVERLNLDMDALISKGE